MNKRWIYVLAALGAAFFLVIGGGLLWMGQERAFYDRYRPALQRDLGFQDGSPYVRLGDQQREVMTLYPRKGGPLYQAGVREEDIVPDERSTTDFYRRLENARGKQIRFRVIEGGDGPPLEARNVRMITLAVPAASSTKTTVAER